MYYKYGFLGYKHFINKIYNFINRYFELLTIILYVC